MIPNSTPTTAKLAAALLAATAGMTWSTSPHAYQLEPAPLTCTTANCQSLILPARINGQNATDGIIPNVWVGQFAGRAGHCLRLDVTTQQGNLAMSVVGPQGSVYTNPNSNTGTCPTCPRVVVAATTAGVYTVVVANQTGAAIDARFTLRVGAYPNANPNCASATVAR